MVISNKYCSMKFANIFIENSNCVKVAFNTTNNLLKQIKYYYFIKIYTNIFNLNNHFLLILNIQNNTYINSLFENLHVQ